MGFVFLVFLAATVLASLWQFSKLDKAALQLVGAAVCIALAGYAWQGSPSLSGSPVPSRQSAVDEEPRTGREVAQTTSGAAMLRLAEQHVRIGETGKAAAILRSALRSDPENRTLWFALGEVLVIHAEGQWSPAAKLAFGRAMGAKEQRAERPLR